MSIEEQLKGLIDDTCKKLHLKGEASVNLSPKFEFGDYCANVIDRTKKIRIKGETFDPKNESSGYKGEAYGVDKLKKIKASIEKTNYKKKYIDRIEVKEPVFMNFFVKSQLPQEQFEKIAKKKENFGKRNSGKGKTVIIDYSSPNIAKPMHVGHLRSTIIGQALYNVYKFLGYKVIGDSHIGDWGTQFGIMIAACKRYKVNLRTITIKKMLDIYVRFNKEINKNSKLQEIAREEFKKLEEGDKKNREIWKILKEKSLKEFEKLYKILGVKFDLVLGESFYEKDLKEIIKYALKKKVAIKNKDNSVVILLEKINLTDCLIQKSDGATLYETRDLATIKYRVKKYNPYKILYVVGNEQSLHFEQLFHCAELLGYISHDKVQHVKFGLVLDENRKKLASRKGRFIGAEDLINKIIELAGKVIKEKNPKLSIKERERAAQIIGVGALKYNDLSQNRKTDIVFDWQRMLSFEENSSPYLQYSYVRLKSILRKAKSFTKFDSKFLREGKELQIIKKIDIFPAILEKVIEENQTNFLANYLFELAGLLNNYYESFPVLKADKNIRLARLNLVKMASITLKTGLNLLDIETLERM